MILKSEEQGRFKDLLWYLHEHDKALFRIEKGNDVINAYYDTDYESDNGLEMDEEGYEEYNSIVFRKVSDGSLFEYNYHDLPDAVYEGKTRII